MNAIEIRNLSKSYGSKRAVSGLNMTVPEGAIYGFIGENGSGKSTTEKMICGLIHKNSGSIKLFGKNHKNEKNEREYWCTYRDTGMLWQSHGMGKHEDSGFES